MSLVIDDHASGSTVSSAQIEALYRIGRRLNRSLGENGRDLAVAAPPPGEALQRCGMAHPDQLVRTVLHTGIAATIGNRRSAGQNCPESDDFHSSSSCTFSQIGIRIEATSCSGDRAGHSDFDEDWVGGISEFDFDQSQPSNESESGA